MHYEKDTLKKRIDLYFDGKPSDEVLTFLKSEGWKWHSRKFCWYAFLSQRNIQTAESLGASTEKVSVPTPQYNISSWVPSKTENPPILPKFYESPVDWRKIRTTPATTEELKAGGLSETQVFEYLKLMYSLYLEVESPSKNSLMLSYQWMKVLEFCNTNNLIKSRKDQFDSSEFLGAIDEETFEDFRLIIEHVLTETDPEVQFIKCAYGVDVADYEWWREYWDPTMYRLGHIDPENHALTPLSEDELYMLLGRMYNDRIKQKYLPHFNCEWWEQLVLWELDKFEKTEEESTKDSTVYIHKGRIACLTRNHPVQQATAVLTDLNGEDIHLNVSFCARCERLFMSYDTYCHYRKRYGVILGNLKMLKESEFESHDDCLSDESPLHLCGYSVGEKEGLTTIERQKIISYVIDRGIMTKGKVISLLNWFIKTHGSRRNMTAATEKWNKDLAFVLQYDSENQKQYKVKKIEKYDPNRFGI